MIAARSALRVLPLVRSEPNFPVLPLFRATAIALFEARYPNRIIKKSEVAHAAARAAIDAASVAIVPSAAAIYAAFAAAGASSFAQGAANVVSLTSASDTSIRRDAQQLHNKAKTAEELASAPLWIRRPPPRIGGAWQGLSEQLRIIGPHWSIWIDWYDDVLAGSPYAVASEAEDAAFTDVPGQLPWDAGAEAVNTEIARRLRVIRGEKESLSEPPPPKAPKVEAIARLAEVASPQPSINANGQLHAGPNKPFDVPVVDEDLSTLPLRQQSLIGRILKILPPQAPPALQEFLRSYDEELKVRGVQPILGLLKDDADIIAASVAAPRAEDEWLEAGLREAFDRFAENHAKFVEHFPLDAEREDLYGQTEVDEDKAVGRDFVKPFEDVKEQAEEAVKSGAATSDLLAVMDKMTEFARVVSTQPPAPPQTQRAPSAFSEIRISPEDRIGSVTTKKRVILGSLGFLVATYNLIGTTVTLGTANYTGLSGALHIAIQMLSSLLK